MKKSINRDQAILILNNMLSNKSLIIHSYSVALVMEYYGKKLNENYKILREYWVESENKGIEQSDSLISYKKMKYCCT